MTGVRPYSRAPVCGDLAAERLGHHLEAVAHAEDRDPGRRTAPASIAGRAVGVHRRRAAGQDDRLRARGPASPRPASCAARSRSRPGPRAPGGRSAGRTAPRSRRRGPGRARTWLGHAAASIERVAGRQLADSAIGSDEARDRQAAERVRPADRRRARRASGHRPRRLGRAPRRRAARHQGPAGEGGWPGPARRVGQRSLGRVRPVRERVAGPGRPTTSRGTRGYGPAWADSAQGADCRVRPLNDDGQAGLRRSQNLCSAQRSRRSAAAGRRRGLGDDRVRRRDRRRPRWYADPSGGRGSASPLLGQNAIARSAWAVIVSDGFTPRLAEIAEPSTTCRPGGRRPAGRRRRRPVSAESPIVQPPMKCAVSGTVERLADRCRPAVPPMIVGHPADGLVGDRDPGRVRLAVALPRGEPAAGRAGCACVKVVIELSRVCITSAMTVRSDQCLRS